MNSPTKSILIVTEGKTEKTLLKRLFKKFDLPEVNFVCLNTNLHKLYTEYESYECDYSDLDLTAVLRSSNQVKKSDKEKLFEKSANDFTDIFLIFDLDPQAGDFCSDEIQTLMDHFSDSSDAGKLFINYPMVESFFHVPLSVLNIEESGTFCKPIQYPLSELSHYKEFVGKHGFKYSEEQTTDLFCRVIRKHAKIVSFLTKSMPKESFIQTNLKKLFAVQLEILKTDRTIFVANTVCLLIPELYPSNCSLCLPIEETVSKEVLDH